MKSSFVKATLLAAAVGLPACMGAPDDESLDTLQQALSMCGQWDTYNVNGKEYVVQQNEWGGNNGQCLDVNGTAFTVTSGNFNNSTSGAPATYPSIFKGCHWGNCTTNSGMPVQVSSIGSALSSWSTSPASGAYDVAYDIWFNSSPSTSGQPDHAEMMVWINRGGSPQPAGSKVGNVTVSGINWDVWFYTGFGWNYIAYMATSPTNSVSNLDIKALVNDSVSRGYIRTSSYLIDIEAGFEIWQGGIGLKTSSFSATVTNGTNNGGGSPPGGSGGGGSGGAPPAATSTPYTGSPASVPGKIEAENFDNGGEGVAYHDSDGTNSGGAYRNTGVDIESTTDSGGGYNVGWAGAGEWLNYTVNVGTAGNYTLQARVACSGGGGIFHVEFGGANKTGTMTIPNTGAWQNWQTATANVTLSAGTQIMRLVEDAVGSSGTVGNFNWINIVPVSNPPPPTPQPPAAPSGLGATAGDALVSLVWNASSGASSYNVLRSTTSGSSFASVTTGLTGTSYTNTGLTNGTTYYYVVTATNSAGTSAASNQASAMPAATPPPPAPPPPPPGGAPCANPIAVSGGQSGNFNTTGPVCLKITGTINGWGCSNFDGRTLAVDNVAVTCGKMPLPPKWSDGNYYFSASGGTYPWASIYWW